MAYMSAVLGVSAHELNSDFSKGGQGFGVSLPVLPFFLQKKSDKIMSTIVICRREGTNFFKFPPTSWGTQLSAIYLPFVFRMHKYYILQNK